MCQVGQLHAARTPSYEDLGGHWHWVRLGCNWIKLGNDGCMHVDNIAAVPASVHSLAICNEQVLHVVHARSWAKKGPSIGPIDHMQWVSSCLTLVTPLQGLTIIEFDGHAYLEAHKLFDGHTAITLKMMDTKKARLPSLMHWRLNASATNDRFMIELIPCQARK